LIGVFWRNNYAWNYDLAASRGFFDAFEPGGRNFKPRRFRRLMMLHGKLDATKY